MIANARQRCALRPGIDLAGASVTQWSHRLPHGTRLLAWIKMVCALIAHFCVQNVSYSAQQGGRQEWLFDEVPAVIQNQHSAIGVTGHQLTA